MKKYIELYEEEKQQHEEAWQRYQEDHINEMEIINFHERCSKKARKASQPKKALSKSDEPKKVSGPSEEEQKPKKHQAMEKRPQQGQEKKLTRSRRLKKHQNYLNLLTEARKKEKVRLKMIKRKNTSFFGGERRSPKFF